MTDSTVAAEQDSVQDARISRGAADRRAGHDATGDVEDLLQAAVEQNRAALDRLAR